MEIINLTYLLKVAITFSVLYVVFWLFLSRNTFHMLNRALLLAILILSVILPLVNILVPFPLIHSRMPFEFSTFTDFSTFNKNNIENKGWAKINWLTILKLIYSSGILVLLVKPIKQLYQFRKLKHRFPNQKIDFYTLIQTTDQYPPFSFFYWLFIPAHLSAPGKINPVIEHEKIHARQLHSLDLLLAEFFSIFLWFVPFVYSFKRSIKNVHEYIADSHLVTTPDDKTNYLQLLANETEKYVLIGLSSNFYCKTLKKRITMITKDKSKRSFKLSYLVILPVLGILFYAFNADHLIPNREELSSKTAIKQAPSGCPVNGEYTVTSAFGMRMHPIKKTEMMHNGIDLKAQTGTPVVATASGTVIKSEFLKDTYGEVIVIEHDNTFTTLYAQLSERNVKVGDKVTKGQRIGRVGSSGMSTGAHLHYEVIKGGENVNPADYME